METRSNGNEIAYSLKRMIQNHKILTTNKLSEIKQKQKLTDKLNETN
jgi:hypothetical protein